MGKSFLLADAVHINKKNFESLITFCSSRDVDFITPSNILLPIDVFGNYSEYITVLSEYIAKISSLSVLSLFELKCRNINVFDIVKAEMMSFLCVDKQWIGQSYGESKKELLDKAFVCNKDILLCNMAAGLYWIEYWYKETRNIPRLTYAGAFSGSLIYAKALIETMKFRQGRMFVFESFFTGIHYYCEEKYGAIANKSDIRHKTIFNSLSLPQDQQAFTFKRLQAFDAVLPHNIRNKNVTQPQSNQKKIFANKHETVLFLGQVLNDFSVLETGLCGISSINFYIRVISLILENTDLNIIFKSHPWEKKKHNLKTNVTFDILNTFFDKNERVIVIDEYRLEDLFNESSVVVTLNSQSGIEAAAKGFKPIVCGDAFYGSNDFTTDISLANLNFDSLFIQVISDRSRWRLTFIEFEQYLIFLVRIFDKWLVAEKGGNSEIRLKEIFYEIAAMKPKLISESNAQNLPITSANKIVVKKGLSKNHLNKKVKKLLTKPREFFRDTQSPLLKKVGGVVYGRT